MNKEDYIFGTRTIIEAIKNSRPIDRVLIKKGLSNELFSELFTLIRENQIAWQFVPIEKINRITRKNHQGVVALLSPIEYQSIENIVPDLFERGLTPLLLILDQVTDVRNLGAIVRSAECAGAHAIIIPDKGMAQIGADAVKTSVGALNHIPVCRVKNLVAVLEFLRNSGITIVAATEKAEQIYTQALMDIPLAIVMGSEDRGISTEVLNASDEQVKIPIYGKIESLNVSVAAGLMLYEAVRQRH